MRKDLCLTCTYGNHEHDLEDHTDSCECELETDEALAYQVSWSRSIDELKRKDRG